MVPELVAFFRRSRFSWGFGKFWPILEGVYRNLRIKPLVFPRFSADSMLVLKNSGFMNFAGIKS